MTRAATRARGRTVLLDTGPLVALLNGDDDKHARARETYAALEGARLVTCEAVITETAHLLRRPTKQQQLQRWVAAAEIDVVGPTRDARGWLEGRLRQYSDLPMDYADAVLLHLADVARIRDVWTYDRRDFGVYRIRGRALRIVG